MDSSFDPLHATGPLDHCSSDPSCDRGTHQPSIMALRILGWPGGAQERHFPIGTTFLFLGEVIFRREPVVEILRNIQAKYPGLTRESRA
jgi:hypothetical protein